ncbi:superoxide dismutase [Flavobacterium magnum]|uniref:Superoxide dismutase [Cu-Zn] n=1 Tax=Flavobacterium magnum TaxID=2162713 RepID=A0A2S0RJ75_9FLAO|nr:superoxide dismutase family protein [Flavobacterium magnum]AWA30772.1 superoxide dismutase [Flavobacterium magnum]
MKKILISAAAVIAIVISCKSKTESVSDNAQPRSKTVRLKLDLMPKSDSKVSGTATFVQRDGKVTFTANISGLKPGVHAIHIHEKADCSAADGSSAGGHWNPTFESHGKWGTGAYHKGDIGNFPADEFGNGTITMTTDEWCIGCGDPKKDILGKGLIVHQDPDDFTSQPAGNAGKRVACSAIIK